MPAFIRYGSRYAMKAKWMDLFYHNGTWASAYRGSSLWNDLTEDGYVVIQSAEANGEVIDFFIRRPKEN